MVMGGADALFWIWVCSPLVRSRITKMLMCEIRKCPECSQVISVVIRQTRRKSDYCNWYAEWMLENRQLKCPLALKIAKQFQARFDLALNLVSIDDVVAA